MHEAKREAVQPREEPTAASDIPVSALLDEVVASSSDGTVRPQGIATGRLVELHADGHAYVSISGLGMVKATGTLVPLSTTDVGRDVALGFDGSGRGQALILGWVWQPCEVAAPVAAAADTAVVRVDGERVVIEAQSEIELRCGEAALILSADGRIHLRGHYITSQASATQRILGGFVNVN